MIKGLMQIPMANLPESLAQDSSPGEEGITWHLHQLCLSPNLLQKQGLGRSMGERGGESQFLKISTKETATIHHLVAA